MLEIGSTVFGDWTVEERIGSGAFGTVYKIKRENFGTEYYAALKVINIPQDPEEHSKLRSEGMDNESISTYYGQIAQDFIKEIELLSSLDGITNIVDYKDHNIVPNDSLGYTIYIKMQLLTPLSKKLVDNNGNAAFLSADEILNLGIDICSALEVCEKHKIIHRDIKIDNIFMSSNGDYKLGDFGIAKQLEATQGEMSKKGTMMYMAPEVFKGENYNHTVDIYSLGIVMYRLFNKNRAPFFPQYPNPIKFSDKETANAQRLNGAELPAIPGLNNELMAVLRKACAYKAEDRYQSAAEFKKELKNILKVLPNEIIAESIKPFYPSISTDVKDNIVDTSVEKSAIENTVGIFVPTVSETNISDKEIIEDCSDDVDNTVGIFETTVSELNTSESEPIENSADDVDNTVGIFVANVSEINISDTETTENCVDDVDNTVGVFTEPESLVAPMESNESIEDSKEVDIEKTISGVSCDELKKTDALDVTITEPKKQNKNKKIIIVAASIIVLLVGIFAVFNNKNNEYVIDDNIVNETDMLEKSGKTTKKHKETTTSKSDIEDNEKNTISPSSKESEDVNLNISTTAKSNNKKDEENGNNTIRQESDAKETTKKKADSSNESIVPDVTGKTESEAKVLLKNYNVSVYYIYTNSTPKGYAYDTYPNAGTLVEKNNTVELCVSAGSGDNAWSAWSENTPNNSDIAYTDSDYDASRRYDGKGILVDRKYRTRSRLVYLDRKTGEIVSSEAWNEWQYDFHSSELISNLPTPSSDKYQKAIQSQNQTLYRWRIDYIELAD